MKKTLFLAIAILMIAALFAACSGGEAPQTDEPGSMEPSNPDGRGITATIEKLPVAEAYEGKIDVEYIEVSGLLDSELQDALNMEIFFFCTWPTVNMQEEDISITVTIEYSIIADKFISIRASDSIFEDGAAHPVNSFRAIIFDLETGSYAGNLIAFMDGGDALREKITDGAFVQIFPEEPIEGAAEILAEEFNIDQFYLTEDSVGLFLTDRPHATGSYWIFEAKYDDIMPLLDGGYFAGLLK